jgi:hypothetical protein
MNSREQKLQMLCLNPDIAIQLMEDFIHRDGGLGLKNKRQEVRDELADLLADFCNLILPDSYKQLKKEFAYYLNLKTIFNLKI